MGNTLEQVADSLIEDPALISEGVKWEDNRPSNMENKTGIDVMSFNVPTKGPNVIGDAWKYRSRQIASLIMHYTPDIVCFQEPHESQTKDLAAMLPDYKFFGRGRDEDGTDEYTPIFFLKERFEMVHKGFFWLSETPHVPGSMGWDAACRRVCVWMRLREKRTDRSWWVWNTHWDHRGDKARTQSGYLMRQMMQEIMDKEYDNAACILAGDFNCFSGHEGMTALDMGNPYVEEEFNEQTAPAGIHKFGLPYSFRGWNSQHRSPIDHVLYRNAHCVSYGTLTERLVSGRMMSDHMPLLARFRHRDDTTTNSDEMDEQSMLELALKLSLEGNT